MSGFDTVLIVDWSGGNDTGPTPRKDAIWACVARDGRADQPVYLRNRVSAEQWIGDTIAEERAAGRRVFAGFDFPFAYPSAFLEAFQDNEDPLYFWSVLEERIADMPDRNNRFDVAADMNRGLGQGRGPFWGNPLKRDIKGLARNKKDYRNPFPDKRQCEIQAKGAFTCWQLSGVGSVGSQMLMGLPVLQRLRKRFGMDVAVWPFEPLSPPVAFVEVWPSLISSVIAADTGEHEIKDAAQVRVLATRISAMPAEVLADVLDVDAPVEGWIFGLGHEDKFGALAPPPLRDDCFALPAGVEWTPVDAALAHLKANLSAVTAVESLPADQALGRVLAADVVAARSNPPLPNTAVDGYGFAGPVADGVHVMPLMDGRAAAGLAFDGVVPKGQAIRIFTGASLPRGVDTVILQEDVTAKAGQIAFHGPLKAGANTRKAGEDVVAGDVIAPAGRRVTPADLALMAAVGVDKIDVRRPLRVGVLSTGDEVVPAGGHAAAGQIYDANRPMLLGLIRAFGHAPVDLGIAPDNRDALRRILDDAATRTDAILTSGGASSGDEDHVSALLSEAGAMGLWRIAVKPGRPLALGLWGGVPVFGLPGNPVAAMVCSLIFARPALGVLAGSNWSDPIGFAVPAAFAKSKKAGRREYLRARMRDGQVEVFASEGSGRISGLSWAEGLVELPDGAHDIKRGDLVRFIPFGSFDL